MSHSAPSSSDATPSSGPAIIVLGSSNTDLVVSSQRLPTAGETVTGGAFFCAAGGKGANQAVAAARAGGRVTFLGAIGDDAYGAAAQSSLAAEAIDLRYLKTCANTPSGIALILVDEHGENMISVAPGANALLAPADVERVPRAVFDEARVFLASLETPLDAVDAGLRRARAAGVTTILNPAPATRDLLAPGILPLVDFLIPNRTEAELLTGCDTKSSRGLETAAQKLRDAGVGAVVFTLGSEGCLAFDPRDNSVSRIDAPAVQAVDATAAGDTFCGALAVALAEGRDLPTALRFATAAAAISVTRRGAQPSIPRRGEIDAAH